MTEQFKVLTEVQHLLARPNMYIGSTSLEKSNAFYNWKEQELLVVPGLLKIIFEILDNSIDEAIRTDFKFANEITVTTDYLDSRITITDNGRGIPIKPIGESYIPVVAWSQARAGSNFQDKDRPTIGMNGVGSFATNVFSKEFNGITSDGSGKTLRYHSINNLSSDTYSISNKAGRKQGTQVDFIPDYQRFELTGLDTNHLQVILDRLNNLAISYPKIKFVFNGSVCKGSISQFGNEMIEHTTDDWVIGVGLSDQSKGEFQYHSYVNGLHLKAGGSHLDYFVDTLVSTLRPIIQKKWKIEVKPNHIKQNLFVSSWLRNFKNMKFDSQTKERLSNTQKEVTEYFNSFDFDKLAKQIVNKPEIIDPIVRAIVMRRELAEAKEAADKLKAKRKQKIANHLPANAKDWNKKFLFLTEGLSAVGLFIKVRNAETQGAYALKGKVVNTHGMKTTDIVKNVELAELITITGLDLAEPDYDELEYGYFVTMTDADHDGTAIFGLLLQFFSRWPKLFKEGRVLRLITPLYIAKKKNVTKWYYTQSEYDQDKDKLAGFEVSYNKGLGSLNESDYEQMLQNPRFQKIVLDEKGFEPLELAFGDSADARKEWMSGK